MKLVKDLKSLFLPRRASTQTWMTLTFALFVGGAVLLVGLYAFVVLRGQVHDAAREMLRVEARYVATQLEAAEDADDLFETLRRTSEVTPYRVGIATRDSLVWEMAGGLIVSERGFMEHPEIEQALDTDDFGYDERTDDEGRRVLYVALYRPISGYIIRLGHVAPPLLAVIKRMQATLVIGLALTLVLALIGAWIAAQ